MDDAPRAVTLRSEVSGSDRRNLWAYYDSEGNLRIDGQDLGPGTAPVSDDGEYEWFQTIKEAELSKLRTLLGIDDGEDILDALEERWSGPNSYHLEKLLRGSDLDIDRFVWS